MLELLWKKPYLTILKDVVEKLPFKKEYINVTQGDLAEWSNLFKTIQGKEAWEYMENGLKNTPQRLHRP